MDIDKDGEEMRILGVIKGILINPLRINQKNNEAGEIDIKRIPEMQTTGGYYQNENQKK